MHPKNRITYRFDRNGQSMTDNQRTKDEAATATVNDSAVTQEKPFAEKADSRVERSTGQASKSKVVSLFQNNHIETMKDIHPWNSPFQEDIGALEQLIRQTGQKKHSAAECHEQDEESFIARSGMFDELNMRDEHEQRNARNDRKGKHDKRADYGTNARPGAEPDDEPELERDREFSYDRNYEPDDETDHERTSKQADSWLGSATYTRRAAGPSWLKVCLSVFGALTTGALFGYILLSLFTGASLWPWGSGNDPIAASAPPAIDQSAGTGSASGNEPGNASKNEQGSGDGTVLPATNMNPEENLAAIQLTGLEQTYYMLQFGVFSNAEGRDAALGQLKDKGIAGASMKTGEVYRVYAGMSEDKGQASLMASQLPGIDLYLKEVPVKPPAKLPFGGDAAAAQAFFEQTAELSIMWNGLIAAQLEQPALSPLGKAAAEAWKERYEEWKQISAAVGEGTTDSLGAAYSEKIIKSVNAAAAAMQAYDKETSRGQLTTAQSAIMEAILAEKEWFDSSSAL